MEGLGTDNIRDVIAFPKNQQAQELMTEAPAPVDPAQLRELGLGIVAATPDAVSPGLGLAILFVLIGATVSALVMPRRGSYCSRCCSPRPVSSRASSSPSPPRSADPSSACSIRSRTPSASCSSRSPARCSRRRDAEGHNHRDRQFGRLVECVYRSVRKDWSPQALPITGAVFFWRVRARRREEAEAREWEAEIAGAVDEGRAAGDSRAAVPVLRAVRPPELAAAAVSALVAWGM